MEMSRFIRQLRKLGFTVDFDTCAGGTRTIQFGKLVDTRRKVIVQLWGDGGHRATHEFKGCSDTRPTDFTALDGMDSAIKQESTRTDGKYCIPGSLPTERL